MCATKLSVEEAMRYYKEWVGKTIMKKSAKPFKSGFKMNTVAGITINPNTSKLAFSFAEDQSVVDCDYCRLLDGVSQI